ncbi:MAG: hypothetical protein K0U78_11295 [Actinomycetia bacterium]|nr:hypothetical protein [Actinomycetes bacterium]
MDWLLFSGGQSPPTIHCQTPQCAGIRSALLAATVQRGRAVPRLRHRRKDPAVSTPPTDLTAAQSERLTRRGLRLA